MFTITDCWYTDVESVYANGPVKRIWISILPPELIPHALQHDTINRIDTETHATVQVENTRAKYIYIDNLGIDPSTSSMQGRYSTI